MEPQGPEGLCPSTLWSTAARLQREPEPAEGPQVIADILPRSCPKEPRPNDIKDYRPVALTIERHKDPQKTHPGTSPAHGPVSSRPPPVSLVDDAITYLLDKI